MYDWQDRIFRYARGRIEIPAEVFRDAYIIIKEAAQRRQMISYSEVENQLKDLGHRKINRGTIGGIVGEVSLQVSQEITPSIYPSAIVVHKGTDKPGDGFWSLDKGTNPPSEVSPEQRQEALSRYQNDVFNRFWEW